MQTRKAYSAKPASPLVMVVDDDELAREATKTVLATHGFQVLDHASAQAALEALECGVHPDLILLDLMMPQMDGWEFRRRQLADTALAAIPVVAVSGARTPRPSAIDATAFLAKPLAAAELLCTVQGVLAEDKRETTVVRPRRRVLRPVLRRRACLRRLALQRSYAAAVREEEQRQHQLGLVSRAVSHIVNNALQGLISYAQCSFESREDAVQVQRSAFDSAWHCAALLRRFADCSLLERRELAPGLDPVPTWILEEWRQRCPARVELRVTGLAHLRNARVTPAILESATRALMTNAVEAIEGKGTVTVQVSRQLLSRAALRSALPVRNRRTGVWCCVEVIDDGCGIALSQLPLIWSPFYSSKFADRGLGLTEVLAQVAAQGGLVDAHSAPGLGTTVRLLFRLVPDAESMR